MNLFLKKQVSTSLKPGFSLIEIAMVIMIIGVLMAGALGGYRFLARAKEKSNETNMSKLDTALEEYKTKIGEYPQDLSELMDGPTDPQLKRKWGLPLVESEKELEDVWGHPYVYARNPKGSKTPYELYSTGPNNDQQLFSGRSQ